MSGACPTVIVMLLDLMADIEKDTMWPVLAVIQNAVPCMADP